MKTFKSLDMGCTWKEVIHTSAEEIKTTTACQNIESSTTEFWNIKLSAVVTGKWEKANDEITTHIKFVGGDIVVSFSANLIFAIISTPISII